MWPFEKACVDNTQAFCVLVYPIGCAYLGVHVAPEQLDLWAERILDAKTIDDVFGEEGRKFRPACRAHRS